ncbi:MAG: corrinoid protein [Caldilineaceae bacterium]|nr:corrinoid protein [Caldilineaceae bacterium]MBP8109261.1 corrinoid protein [Caldilineaceae bacterium]MBP8123908.1 corrinoid protein [Caldilineaceae bacterium]MBP9071837.1 corrinoid protein [Caldilineaceae bacterium]
MSQLDLIYQGILTGNRSEVSEGVQKALDADLSPETILNQGMIAAMQEVGKLFEEGEYFVPEMLIAARAMQAGLVILKPKLAEADIQPIGKVAIGTVKGDLHDIGKNLVAMMMEGAGFSIVDLGTDASPEDFVTAVQNGAHIIGLSALLTTTMPAMESTIRAIEAAGIRKQVKIIIGGAPVTADYATKIGADGYAADAGQAATLAKSLIS